MNIKDNKITAYKVRDPKTGLFQLGGCRHDGQAIWSKQGKVWNRLGHVQSHFTQMRSYAGCLRPRKLFVRVNGVGTFVDDPTFVKDPIDPEWEIIELVFTETASTVLKAADVVKPIE